MTTGSCLANPADPRSALPYLRNKNIEIHPRRSGLRYRLWARAWRFVNAGLRRELLANDPQVVISEQIVENAVVLRALPERARTVLDFGGVESLLPLTLAALGYQVTVWDQRRYAFTHPALRVINADIFQDLPADLELFDAIVSVSTIEHLGLGAYGDLAMEDADARGVRVLWSILKPGGRMIVTIPVGKAAVHPGFRVYDSQRLEQVFPYPKQIMLFRKDGRGGAWRKMLTADLDSLQYEAPAAPLPVEAVGVMLLDKPAS